MTDRQQMIAAIARQPGDLLVRRVMADWLEEQGEPTRATYVRASLPGSTEEDRDRAHYLLQTNEHIWMGEWASRLVDWTFRGGFLHRVRMTARQFLQHGEALFRFEPVYRLELVEDNGTTLQPDSIREVVAHPAFGRVRDCAVLPGGYFETTHIDVWMHEIARHSHVKSLRKFGVIGELSTSRVPNVLEEQSFAAFCTATHLRGLQGLQLSFHVGESSADRPWLVPLLAKAPFANRLRSLILREAGLTRQAIQQFAQDPRFARVRQWELSQYDLDVQDWDPLYHSSTLARVEKMFIPGESLPGYATSPLAQRVRHLHVGWIDSPSPRLHDAWLHLIRHAPRPHSLILDNHNPGRRVFAAMHRAGWLRGVRRLDIVSDSQGGTFLSTSGIRSLFGPKSMPRLRRLRLHELLERPLSARLAEWQRLPHLEALDLGCDYYGRLVPSRFAPAVQNARWQYLEGVLIQTDEEMNLFLQHFPLNQLRSLALGIGSRFDPDARQMITDVTPAAVERLLRSPRLAGLCHLELRFAERGPVESHAAELLADPGILPRLRTLRCGHFYAFTNHPETEALRRRLGAGLL
jgi:uncharacterized protein (TIGR02996 family)